MSLYVIGSIDPQEFKGSVLSIIEGIPRKSDLDRISKDYNNGEEVFALPWDEVYDNFIVPYQKKLQGPWKEVTEERFWEMLECLPPMRWNKLGDIEFFFVSEATTGPLHACFVRKGDRYYEGLRDRFISIEELIKQIEEL